MIGHEIGSCSGEELVRLVRALGRHRYVASRLHVVHAFVFDAAAGEEPILDEGATWARRALGSGVIDIASKDERLFRNATDDEVCALVAAFWLPGEARERARTKLYEHLRSIDALPPEGALPFDESREDEVFPRLLDGGWELLPLSAFDPERHKGAIGAFDDFDVARFEEENTVPPVVTLCELPLIAATELLSDPADAPFVVWTDGHESYVDYVLRGVLRAAKLAPRDAEAEVG
jgi:hypothetical protein